MTSETVWERLRRQPFQAFTLNTSDGKSYEIRHPEMTYAINNSVGVAQYSSGERPCEDVPSCDVVISPLHVAGLEDLPASASRA